MRDLVKNTVKIWYTYPEIQTEKMNGSLHTGEFTTTYVTPIEARISMYPANSEITEQLFGTDASFDMVASTTKLIFTEHTLIFTSLPINNYSKTYDYSISKAAHSLNSHSYGLKKRV